QLAAAGIESVVLSTGYMADQVASKIGSAYAGMRVSYSREPEPLGTGGAVRLALEKTTSNPLLVLNGDSFCKVNLDEFYAFHRAKKSRATILLTRVADTNRFGRVEIDR